MANGVEAPVALPGWALAPLAEVMCRESDLLSAVCLEVTTGVTRWKTKGLEPQKKRDATFDAAATRQTGSRDHYVAFSAASARNRNGSSVTMESRNCA